MMDFEEFKENVAKNIKTFLPEEYADAEISVMEVMKNNDQKLTGLAIRMRDSSITPNIYLDDYYNQYADGQQYMEDILWDIAESRIRYEAEADFDINSLMDFEQVKDKIFCRLVNAEMNERYLSDKPHTRMEDLAVAYAIHLEDFGIGQGCIPVTESLLDRYGITAQELHEIAMRNLSESAIEFKSMKDAVIEIMFPDGLPENDPRAAILTPEEGILSMYVLTNAEKMNGAAAVLDCKTMDAIAEKLGGDYVVIPSSIHEVIVMPRSEDLSRQDIERIIMEVNAGQVAPEERLSNHAYQYDSMAHELVRMDKLEEREMQRLEEKKDTALGAKTGRKPRRERVSMKDRLAEKKAESVKNEVGWGKKRSARTNAAALG